MADQTDPQASPFDAIFQSSGLDPSENKGRGRPSNLPKRFWKSVEVLEGPDGHAILLDGRMARTPGRAILASAHEPIARRMAAEWAGVGERIDPRLMPMTRLVNVARDRLADQRGAVLDDVAAFAGSDLLAYRAQGPQGLVARQTTVWDPYLTRLTTHHAISIQPASGIMHRLQDVSALAAVRDLADRRAGDGEALMALHMATTLTGSAVLALALAEPGEDAGRAQAIWQAAHLDEDWNRAQWGEDDEAAARRATHWIDFEAAAFVLSVTRRS
jgi:chaperone required for assembly of F1-ATPase